jgi:hypothetical protein
MRLHDLRRGVRGGASCPRRALACAPHPPADRSVTSHGVPPPHSVLQGANEPPRRRPNSHAEANRVFVSVLRPGY